MGRTKPAWSPRGACEKRTAKVMMTFCQVRTALEVVKLWRWNVKLGRREMSSEGSDEQSELLCTSPGHQMFAELSSAHLLPTSW